MATVTTKMEGDVLILYFDGDLNINNTSDPAEIFSDEIEKKPRVICLNCRALKSIDSSGLGLFIKFLKEAEKREIELVVTEITGNVQSLFDLSKFDNFFVVMTQEEFRGQYL